MTEPSWMEVARQELGVKEVPGAASNPRILEYQHSIGAQQDDEIPWCSSFANWCMSQVGIPGSRSAAARSWARWGVELRKPSVGAVVVLWRGSPAGYEGHVGFFAREDDKGLWLLAGNQGNAVTIKPFPRSRLLSIRWPKEIPCS